MEIAVVPYTARFDLDGRKYDVVVSDLSIPQCSNCGTLSFDHEADLRLETEFRNQLGLLTSEEIRLHRLECGFSQQQLADLIGISVSTLSRWETGAQIQQRSLDKMLRLVFFTPVARAALEANFQSAPAMRPYLIASALFPNETSADVASLGFDQIAACRRRI